MIDRVVSPSVVITYVWRVFPKSGLLFERLKIDG